MRGLDLRKFRKVSADDDFTTLSHYAGHEIRVAHKKLSKAHRSQLDTLPMAKGGKVPKSGDKGPWVDPEAARAVEAGATGRQAPAKAAPTQGEGYTSSPVRNTSPDPDKAKQESLERQKAAFNAKVEQPYADGGEIKDIELKDPEVTDVNLDEPSILAEDIVLPQGAPREMPPEAPGFAQTAGHVIGESISGAVKDTMGGLSRVGSAIMDNPITRGISSGVQGVVQGAAGQPLAAIPSVDSVDAPSPAPASVGVPGEAPAASAAKAEAAPAPAASTTGDKLLSSMDAQARAETKALEQSAKVHKELMDSYKTESAKISGNIEGLMKEYKEGKVDPNHFWDSKSTVGKIGTVLGLLVGGLGGNDMHKVLSDTINRDIESQKANLGKTQNLLDFNVKQLGNLKDATEMTRLMQTSMVKDQLALAAAKVGDPVRKAEMLQKVANYEQNIAERAQKFAAQRALAQATAVANQDPTRINGVIDAVAGIDPKAAQDLRDKATPFGFARTPEGGKTVREAAAANEKTQGGIKRLMEISKTPFKSLSPELRAEAQTIQAEMMGPLRTVMGLGTLSEGDKKLLESMVRNPTSFFSLDSSTRKSLETLSGRMTEGVNSVARSNGLNVQEFKTMGGVQYKKVPGGWQKVQ